LIELREPGICPAPVSFQRASAARMAPASA
jgi:hypothetical protein